MKIDLICDHKVTLPSLDRCPRLSPLLYSTRPLRHPDTYLTLPPLDRLSCRSIRTQTQYLCAAQGPEYVLRSSNSAVTHRTDHGEPSGSYLAIEKIARSPVSPNCYKPESPSPCVVYPPQHPLFPASRRTASYIRFTVRNFAL